MTNRCLLIVVLLFAGYGCGSPTGPSSGGSASSLSFASSSTQEYIGQGQSRTFQKPGDTFYGQMVDGNRQFQLAIVTAAGVAWHLDLAGPPGEALRPGKYFNATSVPYTTAQVSFSGDGRGCTVGVGEFEVLEAEYGPSQSPRPFVSGSVNRFHATFTQRCNGPTSPPLTGEVRLTSLELSPGLR